MSAKGDVTIRCKDGELQSSWFLLSEIFMFEMVEERTPVVESPFPLSVMEYICHYVRFRDLPLVTPDFRDKMQSKAYAEQLLAAIQFYELTDLLEKFKAWCQEFPTTGTLTLFGVPGILTVCNFVASQPQWTSDKDLLAIVTHPNVIRALVVGGSNQGVDSHRAAEWYAANHIYIDFSQCGLIAKTIMESYFLKLYLRLDKIPAGADSGYFEPW